MIDDALSALLQPHLIQFAAPRACASYGGLSSIESVEMAVSALTPFGFSLDGTVVADQDDNPVALWTSPDGDIAVALVENDDEPRCSYLVVVGDSADEAGRLGAVLRKFLPLVEIDRPGEIVDMNAAMEQLAPDTLEEQSAA